MSTLAAIVQLTEQVRTQAASIASLEAERDQLRAEVERLRPNALRYEFLRAAHWSSATLCCVLEPKANVRLGAVCPSGEQLDRSIDRAIEAAKESGEHE